MTPPTAITPSTPPARGTTVYRPAQPGDTPPTRGQRARLLLLVIGLGVVIGLVAVGVRFATTLPPATVTNPLAPGDGNVTLLIFVEPGCCQAVIETAEQIAADYRGQVYVTLADVYRPANESLIMAYQVQALGDMVLLDDAGQTVAQFNAGVPAETLRQYVRGSLVAMRDRES